MTKVTLKTDVDNAVFLLRGLETFLQIAGHSTAEWENISEEVAEKVTELYEERFGEGGLSSEEQDDKVVENFKALHSELIRKIEDAVITEVNEGEA